ncbi:MAG: hypothetical protein ACLFVN_08085 [Phycisphaeraceae bacterium]
MSRYDPKSNSPSMVVETLETDEDPQENRRPLTALLRGRYAWAIGLALVLGTIGAVAGWSSVEPSYRSRAFLEISPEEDPVLQSIPETEGPRHFGAYMDAQTKMIDSGALTARAMEQPVWQEVAEESGIDGPAAFDARLDADREYDEQVVEISFVGDTPRIARAGAMAVVDAYRRASQQEQRQKLSSKLSILERRRDELVGELSRLRSEKEQLAGDYGAAGLARLHEQRISELGNIQARLRQVRLHLQAFEGSEASQAANSRSLEQLAARDPQLADLLDRQARLRSLVSSQRNMGMGENHRLLRRNVADMAQVNRQIQEYLSESESRASTMASRPASTMGSDEDSLANASPGQLNRYRETLTDQLREVERDSVELGQQLARLDEIDAGIKQNQNELQATRDRIQSLNLEVPYARRVDAMTPADLPTRPANGGKRVQMAGLGGFGGAATGVGLIMLVGLLDSRLRRLGDAQAELPRVRLLGVLPTLSDSGQDSQQLATAAHSLHQVRTMLQLDHQGEGQVFVVTSPAAGSGKTSLTTALGLSFAAGGDRTLLIDCDVVGGGLTERLAEQIPVPLADAIRQQHLLSEADLAAAEQQARETDRPLEQVLLTSGLLDAEQIDEARQAAEASPPGLLDACNGQPLENCIVETGIRGLSLLPLGGARPEQVGDLSTASARRLLAQARSRFDTVLVDTGPVLGSIEASMTAAEADRVVLVVSRGESRQMIRKAHEHLEEIGARVAGIVFNHARGSDLKRSSTSAASFSRRSQYRRPEASADPAVTARYGPIGSAVACCSQSRPASRNSHDRQLAGTDAG